MATGHSIECSSFNVMGNSYEVGYVSQTQYVS